MADTLYRGFNTAASPFERSWATFDVDLIKADLLNHFNTRVGERVMRPTFGCKIWDWIMDPLTASSRDDVIEEVIRVVGSDPRCKLVRAEVYDLANGVRVEMIIDFLGLQVIDNLAVSFENREAARLAGTLEY